MVIFAALFLMKRQNMLKEPTKLEYNLPPFGSPLPRDIENLGGDEGPLTVDCTRKTSGDSLGSSLFPYIEEGHDRGPSTSSGTRIRITYNGQMGSGTSAALVADFCLPKSISSGTGIKLESMSKTGFNDLNYGPVGGSLALAVWTGEDTAIADDDAMMSPFACMLPSGFECGESQSHLGHGSFPPGAVASGVGDNAVSSVITGRSANSTGSTIALTGKIKEPSVLEFDWER